MQTKTFIIGVFLLFITFVGIITYSFITLETPHLSKEVINGKKVWQKYNCVNCHTLFGHGAYAASDLTHVYSKRGEKWLENYFTELPPMFPGYQKRHPGISTKEQLKSLLTFFKYVDNVKNNNWPPSPLKLNLQTGK